MCSNIKLNRVSLLFTFTVIIIKWAETGSQMKNLFPLRSYQSNICLSHHVFMQNFLLFQELLEQNMFGFEGKWNIWQKLRTSHFYCYFTNCSFLVPTKWFSQMEVLQKRLYPNFSYVVLFYLCESSQAFAKHVGSRWEGKQTNRGTHCHCLIVRHELDTHNWPRSLKLAH